jgi:hypothetical protein
VREKDGVSVRVRRERGGWVRDSKREKKEDKKEKKGREKKVLTLGSV